MNRITRLLVVLASIMFCWGVVRGDDQEAPIGGAQGGLATQPAFQGSPAAQQAAARYAAQKENATKRYDAAVDEARRQYMAALKREQVEQIRKHNAPLAAELGDAIQQLDAEAAAYKKKEADAKAAAAAAAAKPTELAIDLGGGIRMQFVLIGPGTFMMGSLKVSALQGNMNGQASWTGSSAPPHRVTISKPFYIGRYPVTQEQWQTVMGANPSIFKNPKSPVDSVNFDDCQDFIARVNQKLTGAKTGLPTEGQWEYACRAGSTTEFCYGDDESLLTDYGWCSANDGRTTHPVGLKKPNAWGLYDMHGNIWEFCRDWYGDYTASAAVDPTGPASGSTRVARGGCWFDPASLCRSASRGNHAPSGRDNLAGQCCRLILEEAP